MELIGQMLELLFLLNMVHKVLLGILFLLTTLLSIHLQQQLGQVLVALFSQDSVIVLLITEVINGLLVVLAVLHLTLWLTVVMVQYGQVLVKLYLMSEQVLNGQIANSM